MKNLTKMTAKTFSTILLLLLPFFIIAQVPDGVYPNKTDDQGRKQGAWKKLDEKGTCIYVGQFKDDKPYGTFTYFDTQGLKMSEMTFLDGGSVAYAKMFFINGKLQAQGKYVNQQKDSLWKFYSEDSGFLLSEEWYKNGKKEGLSTVYFPGSTQAASVTTFKNGLEEGAYYEYYADGKKKEVANYVAGNLEGSATWYYPDGRLNIVGAYQHAVKHGTWIYYNADGTIKAKEVWELGKLKSAETILKPDEVFKNIEGTPGVDGNNPNGNGGN
jgi:antitoxin component YwqK of YwqJK toxin-antitoxin module